MILRLLGFGRGSIVLATEFIFDPRLQNHLTPCVCSAKPYAEAPRQALSDLPISAWKEQVDLLPAGKKISGRTQVAVILKARCQRFPSPPANPDRWLKIPAIADARAMQRALKDHIAVHL